MAVEIPQETIERVRETLKAAGYKDAQIAALEKAIGKLAEEYPQAAENFAYWLSGKGGTKYLRPEWLRSWNKVKDAEERIRGYFENDTFAIKIERLHERTPLKPGVSVELKDLWDGKIRAEFPRQAALYFASADSCLTSHGTFDLEPAMAKGGGLEIEISGRVDHGWWDTYHWTGGKTFWLPGVGRISDEQMEKLKDAGAKDYRMESWWSQSVTATVYMDDRGKIVRSKSVVQWGQIYYNEDGRKLDRLPGN